MIGLGICGYETFARSLTLARNPARLNRNAEIQVYESLKAHLPGGWYAWHSLRVREDDGIFGEGDFVVADPDRGLLAVEVKAGNIEQRDGRWFQNGRAMRPDPRAQGNVNS